MLGITGHKGFVGQHLVKELNKRKISWVGYDIIEGNDIRDKHNLEQVFEKEQITEVIHLAARAGVRRSKKYLEEYISTNIIGTQNIVDLCNEYEIKKLIFYSSSSVYGDQEGKPVKEDTEKKPLSLYGITKLAGEHIVNNAKCKTVIIRPFTVYGEQGRKDEVVYKWLEQIKASKPITVYDKESYRGYVYVRNLIETTINLMYNIDWLHWYHEDFNLGGSEIIYLKDILKVFQDNLEFNIDNLKRPEEDVYRQCANTTKAKEMLGFDPEPRFIKNLQNIIDDFKKDI